MKNNYKNNWEEAFSKFPDEKQYELGEVAIKYAEEHDIEYSTILDLGPKLEGIDLVKWAESREDIEKKNTAPQHRKMLYDIEPDMNKADFLELGNFHTFAVIDKQGEWKARSTMGMFGLDYNEQVPKVEWSKRFIDKFINPLNPNDYLVVVDCHT